MLASNRLREYRLGADMTQAEAALAVRVTQPTYQRWETGGKVPAGKLAALAKLFNATQERLLGINPPIKAVFYDNGAPDDQQYYGEVSIHFVSGGAPLVLSISEKARMQFSEAMMETSYFIPIRSLTNQLVAIRRDAIADIYFCSEAYDDFGPEHKTYEFPSSLRYPDNRDWEIIESIVCDFDDGKYDAESVAQLTRTLCGPPDDVIEQDLAAGRVSIAQVEEMKRKVPLVLDEAENLALLCVYQISPGKRRKIFIDSDRNIYDAFSDIYSGEYMPSYGSKYVEGVGYHHYLFMNPTVLDFISVPTHKYQMGMAQAEAAGDEDDE
ncbi:helix-turn-helix domain-containing protein [Agrobacterium sp. AGB01]|uniref:helix-turn-helix domain-containing protein n=1 Tax=Agrobacterium sp. AGB01 TaxID=2769302 RepID=UPI001786ED5C|nr:helix-turn-helix transcriptional regulator [Agrobacterium sp. AGB01]MBD9386607.1 helix-turn-helix domain-containing protein [Agrobacterium sp. AGB01]